MADVPEGGSGSRSSIHNVMTSALSCLGCKRIVVLTECLLILKESSPVLHLLTKLLGLDPSRYRHQRQTNGRQSSSPLASSVDDEELFPFCGKCSKTVRELADLQSLLDQTEKSIRVKIAWFKARVRESISHDDLLSRVKEESLQGHEKNELSTKFRQDLIQSRNLI
jgi:hypothetical protein